MRVVREKDKKACQRYEALVSVPGSVHVEINGFIQRALYERTRPSLHMETL